MAMRGVPSVHAELQPDIRIIPGSGNGQCVQCGKHAIHQYGEQRLCREHAAQVQASINKLRGPLIPPKCSICHKRLTAGDRTIGRCGCCTANV